MAQRGALSSVAIAAAVGAAWVAAARAEDAAPAGQRRLLGQSTEAAVRRPCVQPNCATVVAVFHREPWEPSAPIVSRGISRNPPFGPYNLQAPPVTQPSSSVQRRKEVWVIEVRRRDGKVQKIEQNYPALFQVGDEVLVEGDRVRAPD
jgi:hypothetical protein